MESNSSDTNFQLGSHEDVRFLFDSEDLFETVVSIRDPRFSITQKDRMLSLLKFNMKTFQLRDFIQILPELSVGQMHVGIDDLHPKYRSKFMLIRHDEGLNCLSKDSAKDAMTFLRHGSPPSLRSRLWRVALGLPVATSQTEKTLFDELVQDCSKYDILTDALYMHDVHTVLDNPRFFPFEENLKVVILCFVRDTKVKTLSDYEVHQSGRDENFDVKISKSVQPVVGSQPNNSGGQYMTPQSAVQPFLGLASYFAPLCYLYADMAGLYSVTRALWCKLWCRLNVISGDRNTLLYVCKTFENLLASLHPRLFIHLLNLGVNPLHVAFPWMHLSFAGYFEVDQLLILWDRVIGYMDPTLFALMAASIFVFRSEMLFLPGMTVEKAITILNEGSQLKVMPLLQMMLFTDSST